MQLEADRKLIKKLEKQKKFDPILERPVDMTKIQMCFDLVSNWVENKLQELLGRGRDFDIFCNELVAEGRTRRH